MERIIFKKDQKLILTVDYVSYYSIPDVQQLLVLQQNADEESLESLDALLIAEQITKLVLFIGILNGKFSMHSNP